MMLRLLPRKAAVLVLTIALGGFLGCLLLRYAPGFDADERDVSSRYSSATLQALRNARAGEQNIFQFYGHYLIGVIHGDFGISRVYELPVSSLIASRAGLTFRLIGTGLLVGWLAGLSLGAAAALYPRASVLLFSEACSGLFLCFPAAILALLVFLANGPVPLVIAAAIFPRVYRYVSVLLSDSLASPQILAAAARGIPRYRLFFRYAVPPVIAPLAAFLGVCFTLAFGACIPVEVICDLPGLGQLAWKAALGRDLPLLAAMTLIVSAVTLTANAVADLAAAGAAPASA